MSKDGNGEGMLRGQMDPVDHGKHQLALTAYRQPFEDALEGAEQEGFE